MSFIRDSSASSKPVATREVLWDLTKAQQELGNLLSQKNALAQEPHSRESMKNIKRSIERAKIRLTRAQEKRNQFAGRRNRKTRRRHR